MISLWPAMPTLFLPRLARPFLAPLAAVLLLAGATAAEPPPPLVRDYSPTEATGDELVKFKAAVDLKHFDDALAIIEAQLPKVEAGSYDLAVLLQYKANTYLQKGDFSMNSIAPLEKALLLSDSKTPTFFDEHVTRELLYFLAQLYYQEAVQDKVLTPVQIGNYFEKADKYMGRWADSQKKPTADNLIIYAQLLYGRASQNADHPDMELIKRALAQVDRALHLVSRPKDSFYLLKLVCLQQLGHNVEVTELLELLIKNKPESSTYWQQLAALYLNSDQPTRAILTIERAQAFGHMNTPKDNYNLIGMYFNLAQYEKSAELLEVGLHQGKVDNEQKTWELLALCYQQLERPLKGIETLKEATKFFPKNGQLEFMIAQQYNTLDQSDNALVHAQAAVAKGMLTKPHQVYLFIAYVAYQLKKFDVALDAAKKCAALPEGAKEGQNMVHAIEEILKDREAKKNKT